MERIPLQQGMLTPPGEKCVLEHTGSYIPAKASSRCHGQRLPSISAKSLTCGTDSARCPAAKRLSALHLQTASQPGAFNTEETPRQAFQRRVRATAPGGPTDTFDSSPLSFWDRLQRAWRILFPPPVPQSSYADIAKERLRLVLYTDRGEVSAEVRQKLREHIVQAISAYVEVEDEDEVQLSVAADSSLGVVYSVTIPVRRVKPEFQEYWSDNGFRDRFYEEILQDRAAAPMFNWVKIEKKALDSEED